MADGEKDEAMFIRTQRLFLRPAWREDAPALARTIGDWEIVRNLSRVPWPYGEAEAEAFIGSPCPGPREGRFLIFWRDPEGLPVLAGGIGFGAFREAGHETELGYWLGRDFQRRGIAVEAGRAVLELIFMGLRLPHVAAAHHVDNAPSGTVLRRLGFRQTGRTLAYPCAARNAPIEAHEYMLTADEWRAGRQSFKEAA